MSALGHDPLTDDTRPCPWFQGYDCNQYRCSGCPSRPAAQTLAVTVDLEEPLTPELLERVAQTQR